MLTFNQQRVASHFSGHAKVLAAAGSGKTTTMVARVKNLAGSGVPTKEIISLMFNRDARDSYREKLLKTYSKPDCPPVFTFHGLGSEILKRLIAMGEVPKARLETSEYKLFVMAKDVLMPWIEEIKAKKQIVMEFLSFVDLVKNSIAEPIDVFKEYEIKGKNRFFIDAYNSFEKQRERDNVRYFSDLIYTPVTHLRNNNRLVEEFANKYQHIIVDEFQDISDIQIAMIQIVAGKRASVMAVGDDDQCIYRWRGAKPDYLISGFDKFFPNPVVFMLNETFRYGHQLALAATHVIKNNQIRSPKLCVSNMGAKKTHVSLDSEVIGQPSVPKQVNAWVGMGRQLNEVAVLVRSYSQAIPVELALLAQGIPYVVEGGTALFDTPDIGALVAGLHIAAGTYKSLPERDQKKLIGFFIRSPSMGMHRELEYSLVIEAMSDPGDPSSALDAFTFKVKEQWLRERLMKRARAWRNLEVMKGTSISEVFDYIITETGVKHHIEYTAKNAEEAEDMWGRYEAMMAYANHTGMALGVFIMHLEELRKGVDEEGRRSDALLITSVHRSKGLEWPFVIMPNLSQGKFPYIPRSSDQPWSVEDERRLFYVAMTRAQEKLVMICPNDRRLSMYLGKGADTPPEIIERDPASASQFVYESNIFLSQRADLFVDGKEKIPAGVVSPETTKAYLSAFKENMKLKKAN